MTTTTVLRIKLDATLKRQAQATAKEVGLSLSTVVAAILREFVRTRSVVACEEELLEDFLAATNPRIIKKIAKSRAENELLAAEEVFGDL